MPAENVVEQTGGQLTAALPGALGEQVRHWQEAWAGSLSATPEREWPLAPWPVPEPAEPSGLRLLALGFKLNTTEPDGFHPRQFA
eukprot:961740-Lingulodinium_polyedra.AAC.1